MSMHRYAARITKNMSKAQLYEAGIREQPDGYQIVSVNNLLTARSSRRSRLTNLWALVAATTA